MSVGPRAGGTTKRRRAPGKLFAECSPNLALLDRLPIWLTPDQVAEVLGKCSRETVRALRNKGLIECRDFRVPGARMPLWRFYRDSVRAYLNSGRSSTYGKGAGAGVLLRLMLVPPDDPDDPPCDFPRDVIGDQPPITEAEKQHARTVPDPACFDRDPDA